MDTEIFESEDICRVCRSEGSAENPLFYPCVCMGTIKYVHQDCLVEWLKYSKKETCELCKHSFTFIPIYSSDMPKSLPVSVLITGAGKSLLKILKNWIHYTIVILAWLIMVPIAASRMYTAIFYFDPGALLPSSLNALDGKEMVLSYSRGLLIVVCCVSFFMYLVWLKEQIMNTEECLEWLNGTHATIITEPTANHVDPQTPTQTDNTSIIMDNIPSTSVSATLASLPSTSQSSIRHRNIHVPPEISDYIPLPVARDKDHILRLKSSLNSTSGHQHTDYKTDNGSFQMTSIVPHNVSSSLSTDLEKVVEPAATISSDQSSSSHTNANHDIPTPDAPAASNNTVNANAEEIVRPVRPNAPVAAENGLAPPGPQPILAGLDLFNLNNIDWDRAVEDLTWENLLGLDGSFNFLEHALWMIVFNGLFIFLFAFLPYHYGKIFFKIVGCDKKISGSQFDSFLSTFVGYLLIGQVFLLVRRFVSSTLFNRLRILLGVSFYIIKVCLLMITEIGIFPFMCGWFLDVCSLNLFGATLEDRSEFFVTSPVASTLVHWLVGMVYVFYFASAVIVLREVLRPGILWFLRNLNDPDFNPVKEMLLFPALKHLRRFLCSMVLFSTIITITVYLPTKIVSYIFPKFLPYNFMSTYDSYFAELPLELLLFHVVVPSVMEQNQAQTCIKAFIRVWAEYVGSSLGLRSYLLGPVPSEEARGETQPDAPNLNLNRNVRFRNRFGIGRRAFGVVGPPPTVENQVLPEPERPAPGMGGVLIDASDPGSKPSTSADWDDGSGSSISLAPRVTHHPFPATDTDMEKNSSPEVIASPTGNTVSSILDSLNHIVERVTPSGSGSDDGSEYTLHSSNNSSTSTSGIEEANVAVTTYDDVAPTPTVHHPTDVRHAAVDRTRIGGPDGEPGGGGNDNTSSSASPPGTAPYERPPHFYARLFCLAISTMTTSVFLAVTFFTLPVYIGRVFLKYFTLDITLLSSNSDLYYYNTNINNMATTHTEDDGSIIMGNGFASFNDTATPDLHLFDNGTTAHALGGGNPSPGVEAHHHDLYTYLTGLYFLWFAFRSLHHLHANWVRITNVAAAPEPAPDPRAPGTTPVPQPSTAPPSPPPTTEPESPVGTTLEVVGPNAATPVPLALRMRTWLAVVYRSVLSCAASTLKCLVAFVLLSGLIPLLMGILFEQAVVFPLRIPMDRTPIVFLTQDWMFGLLLVKLAVALTLMGPDWWLKSVLEQIYHDGLANLRLSFIIQRLVWPCVSVLGLCLSLPYVLTTSILSCFGVNTMMVRKVQRHIYPSLLTASLILAFLIYQTKQIRRFYQHIKDERYLVGKKLMNYERIRLKKQPDMPSPVTP